MTHRNHAKDRNDTWTKVTDGNWKVPHMTINRFMRYLFRILVWHSEQLFHYFCARIGFFFLANTGTQMQKKNREFPGFCQNQEIQFRNHWEFLYLLSSVTSSDQMTPSTTLKKPHYVWRYSELDHIKKLRSRQSISCQINTNISVLSQSITAVWSQHSTVSLHITKEQLLSWSQHSTVSLHITNEQLLLPPHNQYNVLCTLCRVSAKWM